jgi:hypothetical protein
MQSFTKIRTSTNLEGSYLVVCRYPAGSTAEQTKAAFDAAQRLFDEAGVDPVECDYPDSDDPARLTFLGDLWEAAERAAKLPCWAPREGTPDPTKIKIYVE